MDEFNNLHLLRANCSDVVKWSRILFPKLPGASITKLILK